ncbi:MAG: sn-glycerol-1-phosphate dehydrogenase [Caldicoprobacterales bacterium]|jgi:glycerol-1-phosphate dehydrogenase [NAD(P)+]|nr:sn-glycerol-1-phosphate dehydrogenase [Clostridiales bacterium]
MNLSELPIGELLNLRGFDCSCGKKHKTALSHLEIGPGALDNLFFVLEKYQVKKPFIICDKNTLKAAGEIVYDMLNRKGMDYESYVFPQDEVEPDEYSVGQIIMSFDPSCDFIIAVGSGVINDIAKIIAKASSRDYLLIATAPSMDGFASNSSSMIQNGVKVTIYTVCPVAIIADIDIMKEAPMLMIQAGLGDMVAKYVSICEWRISNIITGEYYCPQVAGLMRAALEKCVNTASSLMDRDPQGILSLTEGLILSGIAMSFAEVSRPASGLEHYFSHIFDMSKLEKGTPGSLHGIQVGIGTVLTLLVYDKMRFIKPDRDRAIAHVEAFDYKQWESRMKRIFGKNAEALIELEGKEGKNDKDNHSKRLEAILGNWSKIKEIIEQELPSSKYVENLLKDIGAPIRPRDIGIKDDLTKDAFLGSREVRDKYIATSLLWDLGLLDQYAEELVREIRTI